MVVVGGWRVGGEDERRDTKERQGIREDQRLSGKREKVERRGVRARTERKWLWREGCTKSIICI